MHSRTFDPVLVCAKSAIQVPIRCDTLRAAGAVRGQGVFNITAKAPDGTRDPAQSLTVYTTNFMVKSQETGHAMTEGPIQEDLKMFFLAAHEHACRAVDGVGARLAGRGDAPERDQPCGGGRGDQLREQRGGLEEGVGGRELLRFRGGRLPRDIPSRPVRSLICHLTTKIAGPMSHPSTPPGFEKSTPGLRRRRTCSALRRQGSA